MIFFPLLLAHLVGDFLLQPEKLVRWKHEQWSGIAFHSLIHFFVSLIFLGVYLPNINIIAGLILIAGAHFLIDWIKIIAEERTGKYFLPFLVDQAAHLAVLALASYALWREPLAITWEPLVWVHTHYAVIVGLCLLILVTFTYDLAMFQRTRRKNSAYRPHYHSMARRVLIWGLLYGAFLVFGVYKIVAFGPAAL